MPQLILYIFLAIVSVFLDYNRRYRITSYNTNSGFIDWISNHAKRRNRRIFALRTAKNYLKPYEKIFGNLSLSNKFCTLTLYQKEKRVMCLNSVYDEYGQKKMLIAINFSPLNIDEYFDMMCEIFSYRTQYKDIYNSLRSVALINESVYSSKPVTADKSSPQTEPEYETIDITPKTTEKREILDTPDNLTDINNCSEAELTALPGISIIAAKKIINYRDAERPFNSVDDFINVMQIKPHFAKQLKKLVCANKVNMRKVKRAKAERIIDL